MTKYAFEGSAVLVKPPILTESALVKDAVTINPGNVVIDAGPGANAGKYDIGASGATYVRGVAIEKRIGSDANEKRPLTVVRKGLVRVIADGAIPIGSRLKAGATGKVKAMTTADEAAGVKGIGVHFSKDDGSQADAADGDTLIAEIDTALGGV